MFHPLPSPEYSTDGLAFTCFLQRGTFTPFSLLPPPSSPAPHSVENSYCSATRGPIIIPLFTDMAGILFLPEFPQGLLAHQSLWLQSLTFFVYGYDREYSIYHFSLKFSITVPQRKNVPPTEGGQSEGFFNCAWGKRWQEWHPEKKWRWGPSHSLSEPVSPGGTQEGKEYLSSSSHQRASRVAQLVKNLPAMQETPVWFLGQEVPLEDGMAIHSSILTWRITMKRGAWQATVHGLQRVGLDWATKHSTVVIRLQPLPTVSPEDTQNVKTQETGPGWLRCISEEWSQ